MSLEPKKRAYTGSCHCKATRFIVYLTFPASTPDISKLVAGQQRLYRCNCTLCHKAGLMHIRVPAPVEDFRLLSPLDPLTELGDYTCNEGRIHFMFCKTCGVRCFSFRGEGEVEEVEGPDGEKVTAWHPKTGSQQGYGPGKMYLSVNGHAIDAGQEGFDLREWAEKKWMLYMNLLDDSNKNGPTAEPPAGGCY